MFKYYKLLCPFSEMWYILSWNSLKYEIFWGLWVFDEIGPFLLKCLNYIISVWPLHHHTQFFMKYFPNVRSGHQQFGAAGRDEARLHESAQPQHHLRRGGRDWRSPGRVELSDWSRALLSSHWLTNYSAGAKAHAITTHPKGRKIPLKGYFVLFSAVIIAW